MYLKTQAIEGEVKPMVIEPFAITYLNDGCAPKNNEDFPYYHLPYASNIVNHKLQFGIAHFIIAFRTPSSLFYLQSLFYLPYINYYLFHSSGLLILIFSNLFFLDKFFFNKKSEKNLFIKILACLFFVFINIVFAALAK